jgi:hypothetical protein
MIERAVMRGAIPLFREDADEKVGILCRAHGFESSFDLKRKLCEIWYERMSHQPRTAPKAARTTARIRKFLSATNKHATALSEMLRKAGKAELQALLPSTGDRGLTPLPQLRSLLTHLAEAAAQSQKAIRSGRGRRSDPFLDRLITELYEVFRAGRPGKHTVCFKDVQGKYTGNFYLFAHDTLPLFAVNKTDGAIGRRIVRICGKNGKRSKSKP